ncbi:hypothetical protein HELRODRAFT_70388 [Helobdella robusta]|uniref:Endonuclease/exonuclease/phosphatase domain-containing protein n=1 Tax=Helobdella robusta TaxID=6412 RepID=T1G062_HELRO|nr:hypothetical protein HELRODRAFT_70388 [Helobdella robusta]ESN91362.1 hypothetical protein HELRODRAFT_70388 [Helobdella robusta]
MVLRLGTLSFGSLTGRSMEIAEMLERRRIDICCLRETQWKSNGVCHINSDNEIYKTAKNGVGIFVREPLAQEVLDIKRINCQFSKLGIEKQTMIIFSAYAPQTGESEEMKNDFWTAFSETISTIPKSETILIGGDFNGHVREKTDGFDNVHSSFGYGERNEDGNRILEFAEIIPGESCVAQHRLLVADLVVELLKHKSKQMLWRIKTRYICQRLFNFFLRKKLFKIEAN